MYIKEIYISLGKSDEKQVKVKMWHCEIHLVSGNSEIAVFRNEDEANKFYERSQSETKNILDVYNNGKSFLINLRNVELITKPKEYVNEEFE